MTKLLYITAHPLEVETSISLATGEAFIKAYQEANPAHEVIRLDLYKEDIPQLDADVLRAWEKLRAGASADRLTEAERSKAARLEAIVDQYVAADKYVYVSPMWNFSVPSILKAYTDATSIPGKTFKYVSGGSVGLLQDKKALHIQSSGSVYSEGPLAPIEMGHRFLSNLLRFYGIETTESILIEGMAYADRVPAIREKALAQAREYAEKF